MQWRTNSDEWPRQMVGTQIRKIYLWFLSLPWWWSNLERMEDCKKRENSISVARWGTNWGKINPFTSALYWDIAETIETLYIFPHQAFVPYFLSEPGPNFEFDFSMDDWAAALPPPQGVKYFRPRHCHSNCSPISPKWGFIFLQNFLQAPPFPWGWFYWRASSK